MIENICVIRENKLDNNKRVLILCLMLKKENNNKIEYFLVLSFFLVYFLVGIYEYKLIEKSK